MDADDLRDLFADFGPISVRRMFGGSGLYADGLMFGLEADGVIFLKADAAFAADLAARGSAPFSYDARRPGAEPGVGTVRRVIRSFWRLPEDALDESEELAALSRRALAAARAAALPAGPKALTRRKKSTPSARP